MADAGATTAMVASRPMTSADAIRRTMVLPPEAEQGPRPGAGRVSASTRTAQCPDPTAPRRTGPCSVPHRDPTVVPLRRQFLDELADCGRGCIECLLLVGRECDLEDPLHAARTQDDWHADEQAVRGE